MSWPQNPDWATILPQLPVASSVPNPDIDNLDGDANTDAYVLAAWVEILGQWPNQTLPIDLMTFVFDIQDGASGTTAININATSNAAGFAFGGQNHTIDIDGSSSVSIPTLASATQHTYVSSSTRSADGTQETVIISYNCDDTTVTGLGLSVHYDTSKVTLNSVTSVYEGGLFIRPNLTQRRDELLEQLQGRVYRKMTDEEVTLFDYVKMGYIEDNPNETTRDSYVGNYQFGITGP